MSHTAEPTNSIERQKIPCRLCDAPASPVFLATIMKTREVRYYECSHCHSLQTEKPDWLADAYSDRVPKLDIGKVQRNIIHSLLCAHILRKCGFGVAERCLDWGGGEGLFTRLMRDRGFQFYCWDKRAEPLHCRPFTVSDQAAVRPSVVTAFEVFEHLEDPAAELERLFSCRPKLLIFSTEFYDQQGPEWRYLALHSGQHIFFFSRESMEWIGDRHGYRFVSLPGLLRLFVRLDVASAPDYEMARVGIEAIQRENENLLAEAGREFLSHLEDPWRYVAVDYEHARGL